MLARQIERGGAIILEIFTVSLVEHEDAIRRQGSMQPLNFGMVTIGAGRIIWIGQKHQPRLRIHQSQQCVDIGAIIVVRRDHDIGGAFARGNIVNRKAVAHVDDVVAGPGIAHRNQVEQLVRTGAANNLIAFQIISRAQCFAQRIARRVGIARQRSLCGNHRLGRMRTATQRVFIGRQFDEQTTVIALGLARRVSVDGVDPGLGFGIVHAGAIAVVAHESNKLLFQRSSLIWRAL